MHDEAGLGYVSDSAFEHLGGSERHRGETWNNNTLTFGEERRTVDGLVEAGEAWQLLTAGYLAVASNTRVVAGVAV